MCDCCNNIDVEDVCDLVDVIWWCVVCVVCCWLDASSAARATSILYREVCVN